MHGEPDIGSGVERVVHLFASGAKTPEHMQRVIPVSRCERVCYLLSAGGGIARTFYSSNLGISLAEKGFNFALLDLETRLPTAAYLFGHLADEPTIADIIRPHTSRLKDLYEVCTENHIITQGMAVLKLISLTCESAEKLMGTAPCDQSIAAFRQLFRDCDLTLVNLPARMLDSPFMPQMPVNRFLFITKPGVNEIIGTFELMKKVSDVVPGASLGLLVHRSENIGQVRSTFTSLSRAVRSGLGKDLRFMGQFPRHEAIAKSILERKLLAFDEKLPDLRRRFDSISGYVSSWVQPKRSLSSESEEIAS